MFLRCWFVKLDLQYYHIMVCWNTELQYSVIQLLRKHHIDHCLSLLMLLLWCYLYVHFQSFSESSSCFLCTFSAIQWVIVLFLCTFSFIQWVIVLFSYVHFQSFRESSSCFEEFHDDLLAFIIKIFWCIFRTSGIQCPDWRCHWRSSWCNNYCNDHFRDPILHEKER